jgi:transcriptional regulator with XRE-family HTH domain
MKLRHKAVNNRQSVVKKMSEIFKNLFWNKRMEVLRIIKGWSQREAAEKCNTNQKMYWAWETGKNYPRKNSRIAISQALGIPENEIFSENSKELRSSL